MSPAGFNDPATTARMATTWKLLRMQCRRMAGVGTNWQLDEPRRFSKSRDNHHNGDDMGVAESAVHNNCWSVTLGGNPRCASAGNTTCNGTTCCANEKVVSHKCVAYPAGTTGTGDHDASADNTICDPKICGTNKCESHLCGMPCWQGNRSWLDLLIWQMSRK